LIAAVVAAPFLRRGTTVPVPRDRRCRRSAIVPTPRATTRKILQPRRHLYAFEIQIADGLTATFAPEASRFP